MSRIRIRPRFTEETSLSPEGVLERLEAEVRKPGAVCSGTFVTGYAILSIWRDQQHYWSPRLTIEVVPGEKGASVRGLFGPRPSVWTMFVTFYVFGFFAGLFGLIFGLVQWSLDIQPIGLLIVLAAMVLIGTAYAIALFGQRLGHEQMVQLRSVLDSALSAEPPPLHSSQSP